MDVPWFYRMPKHGFIVEKKMRLMAHDEYELCEQGDLVTQRPSHSHARSLTTRGVRGHWRVPVSVRSVR